MNNSREGSQPSEISLSTKSVVSKGFVSAQVELERAFRCVLERVADDLTEASQSWFQAAAEQGDAEAQYELGWLHYHGEGGRMRRVLARRWL